MIQTPKISIIIPVYNTEKYISKCLDSILSQTYSSFEIIIINDGSTDNSAKILKTYQNKFPQKVKVFTLQHKGQAHARNFGIQNTNGKFILFVDSDDFVDNNLLLECSKYFDKNPDAIIFGVKTYYEKKNKFRKGQYSSKNFKKAYSKNDMFKYHTICVNKMYKKDFLTSNNITFSELNTGEEQLFFIKISTLGKDFEIIKRDLYNYRKQRPNSLTYCKNKNDLSPIKNYYRIEKFLKTTDIKYDLKLKILSKYFTKAISWYGKSNKDFVNIYYKELLKLTKHTQKSYGKYWWDYYNLRKNDNYIYQKYEIAKAYILYLLREKLLYIPALIFFFLYLTISGDDEWAKYQ